MNYNNFIAALDIGSSRITLTLATRTTTGEINVIDSEAASTSSVKYGTIINENAVAKEIQSLVLKLQQRHHVTIERVYVTTGGTLLQSVTNTVEKELGEGSIVTEEVVAGLIQKNYDIELADNEEILDVRQLSYKIDGEPVEDIQGRMCHKVEAYFLIVKGRKDTLDKIRNTLKIAEIQMADMFLAPIVIADTTLSTKEKALGVAAVEIGLSTTKIAIYKNDKIRFVATIPMGIQLITSDLSTCLDISMETADLLRKDDNFGAVCSNLVEDADLRLKGSNGLPANYSSRMVVEVIEARVEEILLNVMHQIERSKFMFLLSGGLVVSGSIIEIKNLPQFIKSKTDLNSRIADIKPLFSNTSKGNTHIPESAETCGMLMLGDPICKQEGKEEKAAKEEKPKAKPETEPKKKRSLREGMGSLFSGLFDETDESID